jgi:hypothetical protein
MDVSRNTSSAAYAVVNASRITGEEPNCTGVIPHACVGNSHIDLATWNDLYWMDDEEIAAASAV